ncbi:ABC transporter permease [Streptomyces durocortorensis]|uniref:ABC transporter permease n=1 Tax=Streptomyces durocortorensis TaxID=2811104 RepID=UPI0027DE7284|nr:ABC transporter permease [Streptomyces durocortorensis]
MLVVGNVVASAVGTGTRRIGVLKAVGFTPSQVVRAYVGQALIPAAVGTALGVVAGHLLAVPVMAETEEVFGASSLAVAPWVDVAVVAGVLLDTRERVHEIGVHKALGMTPRQTVGMVLTSVLVTGLVAGVLGVPLGVALHGWVIPAMGEGVGLRFPDSVVAVHRAAALFPLGLGGLLIAVVGALLPAVPAPRGPAPPPPRPPKPPPAPGGRINRHRPPPPPG